MTTIAEQMAAKEAERVTTIAEQIAAMEAERVKVQSALDALYAKASHQEYPKWVKDASGHAYVVNSEADERAHKAAPLEPVVAPVGPVVVAPEPKPPVEPVVVPAQPAARSPFQPVPTKGRK